MIDLHTHTKYSDGTDSVIELLEKAEKANIECLSITDHNTCLAYEEIENIDVKKYYSGKIIKGCEFNTKILGNVIELLGYNIDTKFLNQKLPNIYKYSIHEMSIGMVNAIIETCNRLGVFINKEDIIYNQGRDFATNGVFKEIIKYPENKKFFTDEVWEYGVTEKGGRFYRDCLTNPNNTFFIDTTIYYPTVKDIILLIKEAGGLVFVPHIFEYGDNSMKILDELVKYDIDGFECYYQSFTEEQTKYMVDFCKRNNYYISRWKRLSRKTKTTKNRYRKRKLRYTI